MINLINENKIRLHFVAPLVCTGMGFFNKNFSTSFLGAILASSLLFVFSCSKDESNSEVKHTLTIPKPKNGMVTSEPKGINCGSKGIACKAQVADGAKIKLIAEADAGYELGAWGGACKSAGLSNSCTLTMNADKIASKIFNLPNEYTLTIYPKPINGTIISDIGDINCGGGNNNCDFSFKRGSEVRLIATPAGGYLTGNWGGDDCSGADNTCKLSMNADKTVSKVFAVIRTLTIDRPANGTITSDIGGINCGDGNTACNAKFDDADRITLTAMPKANYLIGDWGGDDCSGSSNTCTLTMDANKTVSKMFPIIQRKLTIDKPANGTITSDIGGINCGESNTACIVDLDHGISIRLRVSPKMGHVPGSWGKDCASFMNARASCILAMDTNKTVSKVFPVLDPNDIDNDGVVNANDVDDDNNGLIDIHDLDMFNNIRHNLDGTSYKMTNAGADNWRGAPEAASDDCKTATVDGSKSFYLCGYELTKDLDFADGMSYASSSVNDDWRPNEQADAGGSAATPNDALNPGFVGATDFNAVFEGNGHSISNLYSRNTTNTGTNVGLFTSTTATATIRNLGVADANLYSGARGDTIGALVGWNRGNILASHAAGGTVNGGGGDDSVGGLVGVINADAGTSNIIASYATGAVNGGGGLDSVGGLVGVMFTGTNTITASYATGTANGSADIDFVGGLVGSNHSDIIASYATGAANGGAGSVNYVGGLVGSNHSDIIASYATGAANGGADTSDTVGALVGLNSAGTITASYAFGSKSDGETDGEDGDAHPAGLSGSGAAKANGLTKPPGGENTDAAAEWDQTASNTKDAWDFGDNMQAPALKYADYDGTGSSSVDYCALFPEKIPGTNTDLECGTSLLSGQRP